MKVLIEYDKNTMVIMGLHRHQVNLQLFIIKFKVYFIITKAIVVISIIKYQV